MLPRDLEWDSKHLGRRVGKIECDIERTDTGIEKIEKWMDEYSLVYLFNAHNLGEQLVGKGFTANEFGGHMTYTIESHDLNKATSRASVQTGHGSIKVVRESQLERITELMSYAMKTSRFYLDKKIGNGFAAELYKQWTYNGVMGDKKTALGYIVGEEILGALTLNMREDKRCDIELLAVDPCYRGLGIGMHLVEAALEKAKLNMCTRVQVVTQRTNYAASRLYTACGLNLVKESFVYHIHRSP